MTVTSCIGLLGGSGANPAGYSCHGTFTLGGHTYDDQIPGNTLYGPGTRSPASPWPSDPALFTTPAILATQHPSGRRYVVPVVLTVVLVAGPGGRRSSPWAGRRRRNAERACDAQPAWRLSCGLRRLGRVGGV